MPRVAPSYSFSLPAPGGGGAPNLTAQKARRHSGGDSVRKRRAAQRAVSRFPRCVDIPPLTRRGGRQAALPSQRSGISTHRHCPRLRALPSVPARVGPAGKLWETPRASMLSFSTAYPPRLRAGVAPAPPATESREVGVPPRPVAWRPALRGSQRPAPLPGRPYRVRA